MPEYFHYSKHSVRRFRKRCGPHSTSYAANRDSDAALESTPLSVAYLQSSAADRTPCPLSAPGPIHLRPRCSPPGWLLPHSCIT